MLSGKLSPDWGKIATLAYLGAAVVAGVIGAIRLLESAAMPGLAAWELVILGLPWTMALETAVGRQLDIPLMGMLLVLAVILNAGIIRFVFGAIGRWRGDSPLS